MGKRTSVILVAPIQRDGVAGGQARAALLLTRYLPQESDIALRVVRVPHRIYRTIWKGFGGWLLGRLRLYAELALALVRKRPDIVHFFSPCTRSGLAEKAVLASFVRLFGARTVLNFRGDPRVFLGGLAGSRRELAEKRIRGFDYVLCQGNVFKEYMVQQLRLPAARVYSVMSGVELDSTPNNDARLAERYRQMRLVFVGRVCYRKGLDVLVEALAWLRHATGKEIHLDIIGHIQEPDFRDVLIEQAQGLGVADAIHFKGALFGKDKDAIQQSASILVLPSRTEGFPNVVLEAMQLGMPSVMTNVGVARDVAALAGAGVRMVPPDDVQALYAALMDLQDEEQYHCASRAAHAAIAQFDIRNQMRELGRVYEQIVVG